MWYASEHGHLEVVEYLVKNGADIHVNDDYALYEAVRHNHLDIVEHLIKNGAHMDKAVCSIKREKY